MLGYENHANQLRFVQQTSLQAAGLLIQISYILEGIECDEYLMKIDNLLKR
jgi:hypothetical protein